MLLPDLITTGSPRQQAGQQFEELGGAGRREIGVHGRETTARILTRQRAMSPLHFSAYSAHSG